MLWLQSPNRPSSNSALISWHTDRCPEIPPEAFPQRFSLSPHQPLLHTSPAAIKTQRSQSLFDCAPLLSSSSQVEIGMMSWSSDRRVPHIPWMMNHHHQARRPAAWCGVIHWHIKQATSYSLYALIRVMRTRASWQAIASERYYAECSPEREGSLLCMWVGFCLPAYHMLIPGFFFSLTQALTAYLFFNP